MSREVDHVIKITRKYQPNGRWGLALRLAGKTRLGRPVAWTSFLPSDLTPLQEWIEAFKPLRIISKWADDPELQAALSQANITVTKE